MRRRYLNESFFICVAFAFIFFFSVVSLSYAEVGVTKDLIKIGMSTDLSGPLVFYGKKNLQGQKVYYESVNDQGGIYGRKIELISYDDEYKPSRTISNFKRLIYDDKVFALNQIFGTPPTLAVVPLTAKEKIPMVAPQTSAVQVAIPPKRYVFPVWPLLPYYGRIMIDYTVSDSKSKSPRVVLMYMDNEFGTQQVDGALEQAKNHGFKILDVVPYKPTTVDYTSLLLRVKNLNPDYLLLHSCIKDTASILLKAKEMAWTPKIIGMSCAVNQSMVKLAGDAVYFGKGYKAFYACYLADEDLPGPREFRAAMKKYAPGLKPDELIFQGYGAAKILCEGIRRAGRDLTREGFVEAMETLKDYSNSINGPVTYGPNYREGAQATRLLKVSEGKFVAISDWIYPKFMERK